ncbi:MAG: twin-arginine translocase subunit TatB [Deltaproteobacteria bacterium]|nr:twin-arginine translocase subunit TatB [Deltaproteobacteria bacterium]
MFGMGFGEILVVLLVALIFLGPEKIPETASTLGKWFYELRRSLEDVKNAFEKDFKDKPAEDKKEPPKNANVNNENTPVVQLKQINQVNEENKKSEKVPSPSKGEGQGEGDNL